MEYNHLLRNLNWSVIDWKKSGVLVKMITLFFYKVFGFMWR